MVSPIEEAIGRMIEVGFFDVLAFVLFLAIFYAIFRKSGILGASPIINGAIALVLSFFIFLYPFLTGFSLIKNLAIFFTQASVWILMFLIIFLLASFFYPNLPQILTSVFKGPAALYVIIGIGIVLIITSGLISVMWKGVVAEPRDIIILTVGIIIFIVLIMIASRVVAG
ncbi:MAG: hypothetical protein QMD14_05840 [Candidatus Aenigmarchaeota archaeon]|nr:hypothetical protein [Candidatus Aenigmarchaeota archaeon]